MHIRPLYDRIVVKRIEEKETQVGGLFIPDSAKEKPQEGEVVSVGKGKRLEDGKIVPLDVQPGDRILFGKYSGSEIKLDGEELMIMREDEVLGILDAQPVKATTFFSTNWLRWTRSSNALPYFARSAGALAANTIPTWWRPLAPCR